MAKTAWNCGVPPTVACAKATSAAFTGHLYRAFWNGVCVPFTFSSDVSSVSTYQSSVSFDDRPPGMSSELLVLLLTVFDEDDDVWVVAVESLLLLDVFVDAVETDSLELELDVTVRLLLEDEDVRSSLVVELLVLDELVTVRLDDEVDESLESDWLELVLSLLLVVLVVTASLDDVDELSDFDVELEDVSEPLVELDVESEELDELELSRPPEDVELDDVVTVLSELDEDVALSDELEVLDEELDVADCVDVDSLLAVVRDSEEDDDDSDRLSLLDVLDDVVSSPLEELESVS